MDFDIPKAGHVFDTSSSKLPVDFLGSEQIPGSNFHDLDFSIFRVFFRDFSEIEKSPNLNPENSIPRFDRIVKKSYRL